MSHLLGKAIVVTGSGRGLGAAYAKMAAALGARVVVNDQDEASVQETQAAILRTGGQAIGHAANVANWTQAGELVDRCVAEWGRIDGLVNNAGLFRLARLEEQREEDAQAMIEVNIMGTLACAAHAIRHMKEQGSGSIVNVTSGALMGLEGMGTYGATKGAVASLTYSWAAENAGTGIRINAVSPIGASQMQQERKRYFGRDLDVAEPPAEANAPLLCYLLSDLAAGINGQILRSDGRQLSLVAHPGIALPVLEQDWTVESIARAFATDLAARQFPSGIMGLEVNVAGPA